MLGYARFRAAYEVGFYPLYEKPPGSLVDFYSSLVPVVGVEPTRPCELRILSPVRLPFRHTGILNF